MNPDQPLLQTKIRPPNLRPGLVTRARLRARVVEGLRGPLTLVIAPAGFGKSTLAADSLRVSGLREAWLSLDSGDNQPGRFVRYLTAALQKADASIGRDAAQMLSGGQETPLETVLTSLINDLDGSSAEMALVLDDYQAINSQAVHAALNFLIEHLPPNLHLVIASRADPPIPAARLRARGQVVELRAADLRFSAEEAAQFLNEVMGLRLSTADIAVLEERTEGWIAGLQMAALSMRDRADTGEFIRQFSGTHRYILDYLIEEVLAGQSAEIQQFLLRTSVLDRFCAPLCAVLVESEAQQAAEILAVLERGNLFLIPLDDERRWYRYHHLFADLLRARLEQASPGLAPSLHMRAALWLEAEGMPVEAVNHALAAGEHEQAARLVEQNTTALAARGELSALMGWIGALPEAVLLTRPWLCLQQSCALAFAGRLAEAGPLLAQVDRALADSARAWADESEKTCLEGAAEAVQSMIAVMSGRDGEAVERGRKALALLPAGRLWDRAAAYWGLGYGLRSLGQLDEACEAFEEQARLGRAMGNIWTLVTALTDQGNVFRSQGRLRPARACFEEALAEAARQRARSLGYIARMEAGLASILYEQNELEAAYRMVEDATFHSRSWPNPNHLAFAYTLHARVLFAVGKASEAVEMLRAADGVRNGAVLTRMVRRMAETEWVRAFLARPTPEITSAVRALADSWRTELASSIERMDEAHGMAALALARLALADKLPAEARVLLERVTDGARRGGQVNIAISGLVLTAVMEQSAGQQQAALSALGEALVLGEAGGYARVFLDEGRPMQALLAQWSASAPAGSLVDYAARLLAQFDQPASASKTTPAGGLVEPLSQREVEVLRLIAQGKTNQQIAETLVVAIGTVKAHCASIFGKLGAANRTEAVTRARHLGILAEDQSD